MRRLRSKPRSQMQARRNSKTESRPNRCQVHSRRKTTESNRAKQAVTSRHGYSHRDLEVIPDRSWISSLQLNKLPFSTMNPNVLCVIGSSGTVSQLQKLALLNQKSRFGSPPCSQLENQGDRYLTHSLRRTRKRKSVHGYCQ